jgi:hypothetical protein
MSAQTAIDAAFNLLKTVPDLGPNLYPMIRYSNDDAQFKALFVDAVTDPAGPIVHTWMVSREATPAKDEAMQAYKRTHTIVLSGYRGFQDGISEPLWQAEIEAICAVFGSFQNRHFDNQFDWSGPPDVQGVRPVFFGSYLCHAARIIHPIQEFPLN